MALTVQQRLDRLKVRTEELKYWRAREGVTVGGWSIDGSPIEIGGAWPNRVGVHKFAATADADQSSLSGPNSTSAPTSAPSETRKLTSGAGADATARCSSSPARSRACASTIGARSPRPADHRGSTRSTMTGR